MKIFRKIAAAGLVSMVIGMSSCTNLDETVYDQVSSENYYNKRSDVIHGVFRPFEHTFYTMWQVHEHEELTADQICIMQHHDWYSDEGKWQRYHRHQYDDITLNSPERGEWTSEWTLQYQAIAQANFMLDELNRLNRNDFRIDEEEWNSFRGQLRAIRAFCYQRLFNCYRNIVLCTTSDAAVNEQPEARKQVEPIVMHDFIVKELLDCLELLPSKPGTGGNGILQGQFTKGAAAALLVRQYLNAEVWIGKDMYDECIAMCNRIISGEFGPYEVAERWDEPFDWNNETSDEVIFAFVGSFATSSWHLVNSRQTIYGRGIPFDSQYYLGIERDGSRNCRNTLVPSYDNSTPRRLFNYELGQVSQKFLKYSNISPDARWKQYVNTSEKSREGMMFLEGYVPNPNNANGRAHAPLGYDIYLLDQCGMFQGGAPTGTITNPNMAESRLENGDFNSGLYVVKYPFYPYEGGGYKESDLVVFRYPEILYSKAECLLRRGKNLEAGAILNSVRQRYYKERGFVSTIAYQGSDNGIVTLDMNEMLDEWGREFLAESRRRTDLIRFGRFQEAWWDKPADADKHYELFPLSQSQLEQNEYLVQNPGYASIR